MIEEPQDDGPKGAPDWMVTFADLMSLLLTFFVLLLSFSNMEIVKFRTMTGSVRNALGLKSEFDVHDLPTGTDLLPFHNPQMGEGEDQVPVEEDPAPQEVREKLQELLEEADLTEKGVAIETDNGVVLQLSGDLLFDSGKAEINPGALKMLEKLAEYTLSVEYSLDIVGYTDNVPISTAVYPSNWELSAARAGQAVRYLTERGVEPDRLRAIGRAETNPLQSNETPEGRAQNRRVEFVFTRLSGLPDKNLLTSEPADTAGGPAGDTQ